jgi:hypothetical protein
LRTGLGPHLVGDGGIITGDEVGQYERLHLGLSSDSADIFGGGVTIDDVLAQRRGVRHSRQQSIEGGEIQYFVHQNVGALRQLD